MTAAAPTLGGMARRMFGVSLGVTCFALANGGNFAVLAVEMSAAGASETLVGLGTSTYFLGTLAGSLTGGRLVARVGYVRAFALFALLAAATTMALSQIETVAVWPLVRCLTGLGIGGIYVVLDSWFNHAADNAIRGRTYAFYETVRLTSVSLGSFVFLGLNASVGADVFLASGALYLLAVLPVARQRGAAPQESQPPRLHILGLVRLAPLGMACCLVGGLTTGAIYGLVPLYGRDLGLSTTALAAFVFSTHFGAFLVQLPAGALADRIGRDRVILILSLFGLAASLVLALTAAPVLPLLLVAALVSGGICHSVNMLGVTFTIDRLDPATYLGSVAGLLIAYDCGTVTGPLLAALAMRIAGPAGLYLFIGGLMVPLALLAWHGRAAEH